MKLLNQFPTLGYILSESGIVSPLTVSLALLQSLYALSLSVLSSDPSVYSGPRNLDSERGRLEVVD